MSHVTENLILETSAPALASTDAVLLQGTLPGYRTFASKCVDGDTCHYLIRGVDVVGRPTGQWETGRGTILVATGVYSLRRDTITGSSGADVAIAFSAGTKYVSLSNAAPNTDLIRFDLQSALGLDFVGMVGLFPVNTLRPGWVKANGAAISRTAYARLFAYYSTAYGTGDGSTTFNVPDYRGEFPRFFDDGRGIDSGRAIAVMQTGGIAAHAHTLTDPGHAHGVYDPAHAHGAYTDAQGNHQHGVGWKGSSGANAGYMDTGAGSSSGYAVTDAAGTHSHNVGVYAAATGISIYSAGTGMSVQNTGIAENRPRNVACAAFIRY